MADAEENVVTEPEGGTEVEKNDEPAKDAEDKSINENNVDSAPKKEDADENKKSSEAEAPKSSRPTIVSNRSMAQDSVVQPLLTGKIKNYVNQRDFLWVIITLLYIIFTLEQFFVFRFIPNNYGVRLLEIWKKG